MKTGLALATCLCGFALASTNASAALITETWTADIHNISTYTGNLAVGNQVSWTVTYNDSPGNVMHIFNDGPNGIGELGAGDDTINTTFLLSDHATTHTLFANVVSSTFIDVITALGLPAGWSYDSSVLHQNHERIYVDNAGVSIYQTWLNYFTGIFHTSVDGGHIQIGAFNDLGNQVVLDTYFDNVQMTVNQPPNNGGNNNNNNSVPLPATLPLVLLGGLALAWCRRQRS